VAPKEPAPPQNPAPQQPPTGGNAGVQANPAPTIPQPQAAPQPTAQEIEAKIQSEITSTEEWRKYSGPNGYLQMSNNIKTQLGEKRKQQFASAPGSEENTRLTQEVTSLENRQKEIEGKTAKAKASLEQKTQEIRSKFPSPNQPPQALPLTPVASPTPASPTGNPPQNTGPNAPNVAPVVNQVALEAIVETPEEKKAREEREKALKEQLTGEDAKGKLRLGYQAALMLMIDKILNDSPKFYGGKRREDFTYSNFATARTGNTGHVDISNSLFKTPDTKVFFNKIPPQILSVLVPSVKLYYVVYPDLSGEYKDSSANQSSRSHSWRIPFDDLPVGFSYEHSDFVSREPLEITLRNEGKMSGCGIKSFQYDYKGTNPSETNSHIGASLELFFQNISLLTKEITISQTDTRFVDGLPAGLKQRNFAYSHLINGASRYINSGAKLLANDQYFRIKAEIGYAEPSEFFIAKLKETSGINPNDIQSYLNAIKTAKISFFLSPINHDISFNEDGTVILKINYQATIDAILSDYNLNIFSISSKDQDLKAAELEINNIFKERQEKIQKAKCSNLPKPAKDAALKEINDNFAKKVEEKKTKLENLKTASQEEIYRKLIGFETMKDRVQQPGLFKVKIYNSAVGVDKDGKPISGALQFRLLETAVIREKSLKDHERISIDNAPKNSGNAEQGTPQTPQNSWYETLGSYTGINSLLGIKTTEQEARENGTAATAGIDQDKYVTVKYIYLGDLIDIAAECLANVKPAIDRPKLMLGQIPINIPIGISSDETELAVPQDADVQQILVNIADIPISLDAFDEFYYQNVIKAKRSDYPLLNFINDIMELLLKPSINPSVFGKKASINNKIRISHFGFLLPYENDREILFGKKNTDNFNGIITAEKLNQISGPSDKRRSYSQEIGSNGFGNYLLIYDSMSVPDIIRRNNGNIDADENSGIYHFIIGKDSGIIKSINFSKTDIPLAAEARALQEGGKVINRLRQMYSSEVRLFGNNIFRPGDYIYIDPIFYGNNNIQDSIGIGGYYMVTKVNTNISPSNFDTTLSCYHQAWVIIEKDKPKTVTPTDKSNIC